MTLSPWLQASAIALFLAGGCRRNVPQVPGLQDAALPTADVMPEAEVPQAGSGRGMAFSDLTPDSFPEFCETAIRLHSGICTIQVRFEGREGLTTVYAFRDARDVQTFNAGSPGDRSVLLSRLIMEDFSLALASDNGRAASTLLQRERSRPVNRRQCEAAANFLRDVGEIMTVAASSVRDGFLFEESPRRFPLGLFNAMTFYRDAVERNPGEVLTDFDRLTNAEDTLAYLQWLYAFSDFHPLPNFEAALRRVQPGHLSPRTVAAVSTSEFWDTLLREDLFPSSLWTPATSVAFGRLNQDGSRDDQLSALLRFLLLGRGYSRTQVLRVLESRRPDLALSNRAPDLAALVREMGRRDPEAFPIGCVNCLPGGGYYTRIRRTGQSFLFPSPEPRDH